MSEDFGIESISPSTIFISGKAMSEQDALDAVDSVLVVLQDTGNIDSTDQAEDTLLGLQRISGKALAKLLYGKKLWWKETEQDRVRECTFEDYESSRHGLRSTVIDRYCVVWEEMNQFPEQFQLRPMRDLIPVAKAIEQGYEISDNIWKKLISATSNAEIISIIREKVKGKEARKNSRQMKLERDGSINLWIGNVKKFIGHLDINSKDEDVQKAIARIIGQANITKR